MHKQSQNWLGVQYPLNDSAFQYVVWYTEAGACVSYLSLVVNPQSCSVQANYDNSFV